MLGQTREGAGAGSRTRPCERTAAWWKLAPQSISSPLARDLVALVRSVGVLRASAGTVGRRASLRSTLLLLAPSGGLAARHRATARQASARLRGSVCETQRRGDRPDDEAATWGRDPRSQRRAL